MLTKCLLVLSEGQTQRLLHSICLTRFQSSQKLSSLNYGSVPFSDQQQRLMPIVILYLFVIYSCILFLNYFMCLVSCKLLVGSVHVLYFLCIIPSTVWTTTDDRHFVNSCWTELIEEMYRPHLSLALDYCAFIHSFIMISSISIICPIGLFVGHQGRSLDLTPQESVLSCELQFNFSFSIVPPPLSIFLLIFDVFGTSPTHISLLCALWDCGGLILIVTRQRSGL